ncbi:MAG TPA: VWA domain-containing protein [Vicinamibacterales bacterium]|nr:VWA domain-containing protein [Vicinamibacterales bacterium]
MNHDGHDIRAGHEPLHGIVFVFFALFAVFAVQNLFAPSTAAQTFRGSVTTVEIPVTVTDSNNRLITGLTKDDFEVFEDGDEEPVTQFSDKRTPVSVGVLLDISDSMRGQPIVDARAALDRFMAELLDAGDEAFAGAFNHLPRILVPWTAPPSRLAGRLANERPTGGTAIYDAIVASISMLQRHNRSRAALIVISDGADTASDRSLVQTREALRRIDAFVYAIAIDSATEQRVSTRVNAEALRELTGPSGGYTEVVRSYEDLGPATQRIAEELNSQYTLGFATKKPQDGSWRTIRVRVKNHDYLARARRGYFAAPARS